MVFYNEQSDSVDFLHPDYVEHKTQIDIVTNVFNGVDTANQYLTQATRESLTSFERRKSNLTLKNFVKRATEAFVGMIFRKSIETVGFSDNINHIFKKIDTKNTIQKFSRDLATALIRDSKVFIAIDTPINGGDPYMAIIHRNNVINWRKNTEGKYEMIVIYEIINEPFGTFGTKRVEQWRVYYDNGIVDFYRKNDNGEIINIDTLITDFDYIPIVTIELEDIPILYDIAKLNIKHMNRTSFKDKYLDMSAIPVPLIWGADTSDMESGNNAGAKPAVVIGVDEAFIFQGTKDEADFQWRELSGNSIKALQEDLSVIEEDITSGVIRAATSDTTSIKTATQSFYEAAESANRVTVIANLLEIGLNEAMVFVADMFNEELDETSRIIVNKDFNALVMNNDQLRLLWEVYLGGALSVETFLKSMDSFEVIDIGSVENELLRIEKDNFKPIPKDKTDVTLKNTDNRTKSIVNNNNKDT